jgi:hypothetical protein
MKHSPTAPCRVLIFTLGGRGYALRSSDVKSLAEPASLRAVPGSPDGVAGLVEWRGHVLTVLDLAHLLGLSDQPSPACLIRLAPPLHHAALRVNASVRMAEAHLACEPAEAPAPDPASSLLYGSFDLGPHRIRLIDPRGVVRRAEQLWREGA